jgi:hypothetical protein
LTLACCSICRWSLNIAWTLYVWQMVPMLNVCNVQNKLWDFLSQMMHKQCVFIFSYSFYSWVKLQR